MEITKSPLLMVWNAALSVFCFFYALPQSPTPMLTMVWWVLGSLTGLTAIVILWLFIDTARSKPRQDGI